MDVLSNVDTLTKKRLIRIAMKSLLLNIIIAKAPSILGAVSLMAGINKVLTIIMLIAAVIAVVKLVSAANNWNRDPDAAKGAMIGALISAGACVIVGLIFKAMGFTFELSPDPSGGL